MPNSLLTIPAGTEIVFPEDGTITIFFRLLWNKLVTLAMLTPDVAVVANDAPQTAAVVTTNAYVTLAAGWYRLSYYLRKTIADGVSSSLQIALGWTDHGTPLTDTEAALTTDTVNAQQSLTKLVYADINTPITFAIAYTSNTPAKMTFNYGVVVELMS